jgi:hypothetical protein
VARTGPGPARYHPSGTKPRGLKFGSGPRSQDLRTGNDDLPGPGEYDPDLATGTRSRTPTASMPSRTVDYLPYNVYYPGPGHYESANSIGTGGRKFAFTRSPRAGDVPVNENEILQIISIPATVPNAPKYLLPQELIAWYAKSPNDDAQYWKK